ncbi:MAG: glycosyltransferase family 39 protein [Oscillospiraceae bacterium]|jgi:hypothetical protein|nr:glycosyltransferase family 39 protein [Oscillospiraceae bacterium]
MLDKTLKYTQYAFFGIFGILLSVGFLRGCFFINEQGVPFALAIVLFAVLLAITLGGIKLYRFLSKKYANISKRQSNIILFFLCITVFLLQIICSVILKTEHPLPPDLHIIDECSKILAKDFNPENLKTILSVTTPQGYTYEQELWKYLQYYPINIPLICILTACYKIGFSPILLNTLFLFGTYLLTCLTAKKVYSDNFKPLAVAVTAAFFPVFYGYTTIYYTDTMSVFWVILGIYFVICGMSSKKKNIIFWVLSALSLSIGFMIKASVGIILPAVLIWLVCKIKDIGYKKVLSYGLVFVICFMIFTKCFSFASAQTGINTEESKYEYQFPKLHWVMMGLGGQGGFSQADNRATRGAGNYDEKLEYDKTELKKRLSEYNPITFLKFAFWEKATRTWFDGTYFINQGYLKNKFFNSKLFVVLSTLLQLLLFFGILLSFYEGARSGRKDFTLLFRIALCGIFLFLLVWETRSRYLINFTPFILLLLPSLGVKLKE